MSKKKRLRTNKKSYNKRDSDTSIPKMSKGNRSPSRIRRFLSLILQIIGLCGAFIAIWIAVTPRVFVYPRISLDPNNPLDTFFAVRNEGHLKIRDVKVECSMKYLEFPGDIKVIGLGEYTNRFTDPKQVASVIVPGEEFSVLLPLSELEHNKIGNADVALVLSFLPIRWIPWRSESLYRFVSIQGKNGQWYWLQQPINK